MTARIVGRCDSPASHTSLEEFFPYKVCINLDRRGDRWRRMRSRFDEAGLRNVRRFAAYDGALMASPPHWTDEAGAYGCLLSHLEVVGQARRDGAASILIFEDDVIFARGLEAKFALSIAQLPADWEMLLFGGIHGAEVAPVSEHVVKIEHTLSTYAYALKRNIYDSFIELNARALTTVDDNNRILQKQFQSYCFMPHLAWVEDDYSDIRQRRSSHWWLKDSLVLWGDEMTRVLRDTVAVIAHRNDHPHARRNLDFLVNYYSNKLPGLSILVVADGGDASQFASMQSSSLCRYEFMKGNGEFSRARAFNLGFRLYEASKRFFIFTGSDVFLERDDLKANLLKARDYDFVSACREVRIVSDVEADMAMRANRSFSEAEDADERGAVAIGLCEACCIFSRGGMRRAGLWAEDDEAKSEAMSAKLGRLQRVFASPNAAWRLRDARA